MVLKCYRCEAWPCECKDGVTLIHGDCLKVLPQLEVASLDATITDPPYGIDFRYKSHIDSEESYPALLVPVVFYCRQITRPGGLLFFWQAMKHVERWHCWFPTGYRLFAAGKNFTQHRPTPVQYSWDPVVFWANGPTSRKAIAGERDFHIGNTTKYVAHGHPCPRPLDTVKFICGMATEVGEVVLDPFAGSGTTLVAAKQLGRKCIGIEIEEKYCQIAANRLRQEVLPFND
jgi:DNA modification methylase